ncbi:MAG: alpha-N-acetylglucosaminidase N-terminal domain-containing protein, partial [Bacteroidaceae bacterium]|nr:alpha-N-acetylglucosaminidase N-terminal domain-containing protein [Bacteroidaceae bacterium]
MRYKILTFVLFFSSTLLANPVDGLLERIDAGASKRIVTQLQSAQTDFFELDMKGTKPVIRGNSWVNIAVGVNWYLKYYCGIHLSWNQMQAALPAKLPSIPKVERHETGLRLRYDFNYCTFSYSMAFWDWKRWQQEIDWMALHGINMPLAAVGHECVWRNLLLRQGFTEEQVGKFIAGPAFLAWWEMNNLEGWGGPLPLSWYGQQQKLQQQILRRMKEFGMHPVLPGYSGMVPSLIIAENNTELTAGTSAQSGESNQSTLNLWNGFTRPGVLMPDDPRFEQYARLFYEETKKLYGTADYYSIDPFHEASNLPADLDFGEAAKSICKAMKQANPKAVWVVQGWTENPREEMLAAIDPADMLVLDLFSECRPMWGIPSIWQREQGYGEHRWLF